MKFGQALSVFESLLPDEAVAPYRQHLMRLQDSAPPMDAGTVHEVLADDLGEDWTSLFLEFDDEPAAAASLGQVHRARWHDGREVAVKAQYPGAAEAISADLRQVSRLTRAIGAILPGIDVKPSGGGAPGARRRGARLRARGRGAAALRRRLRRTTSTS